MYVSEIDNFYLQQKEPVKGCLLALRDIILSHDVNIAAEWKYRMPFFCYRHKMFCYLWIDKKTKFPYLGMVEGKRIFHSSLVMEKRSRMKIMQFDPNEDLPIDIIQNILEQAISLYKTGVIKV